MSIRNLLLLILLLLAVITLAGCATSPDTNISVDETEAQVNPEDQWGIKVLGIRPTAAGRMLNFRYRVIDPEKASSLVGLKAKPYLIDQATKIKLTVPQLPKVGSLRQRSRNPQSDRIYFVLFSNPGKMIQSGDLVTVSIGEFMIENLQVE